uniref:hypothetical protein n=1 Tax=Hassallia byssoidea TaxID=482630 RepID=UPI0013D4B56B|nr:hypothetical protein [Hassalia byssoidea]
MLIFLDKNYSLAIALHVLIHKSDGAVALSLPKIESKAWFIPQAIGECYLW